MDLFRCCHFSFLRLALFFCSNGEPETIFDYLYGRMKCRMWDVIICIFSPALSVIPCCCVSFMLRDRFHCYLLFRVIRVSFIAETGVLRLQHSKPPLNWRLQVRIVPSLTLPWDTVETVVILALDFGLIVDLYLSFKKTGIVAHQYCHTNLDKNGTLRIELRTSAGRTRFRNKRMKRWKIFLTSIIRV